MIVRRSPGSRRLTLGADKGYDTKTFVADLRDLNIAPHVAQNTTRRLFALKDRMPKSWPELQMRTTQLAREVSPLPELRPPQAGLPRNSNQIARRRIRQF